MFRILRQKFGRSSEEIGKLTPYIVRHHYLVPLEKDSQVIDAKELMKEKEDPVWIWQSRGLTRKQALMKQAEYEKRMLEEAKTKAAKRAAQKKR